MVLNSFFFSSIEYNGKSQRSDFDQRHGEEKMVRKGSTVNNSKNRVRFIIPCSDSAYYDETYRRLPKALKEQSANVRHHRNSNALVNQMHIKVPLQNWEKT